MIRLKSLFAATCLLVSAVVFAGCSVPTATPTAPATATPMATATAAPTAIVAPTATANLTPTQTPLPTPTLSPTQLPTPTAVATPTPAPASVPSFTYEVVNVYPHDADAFTQGLVFDGGALYEGTGIYGKSSLRKVRLDTGEVLQRRDLAADLFGEGIAVYGDNRDRIVQLTWRNHTGFVYDKNTFQSLRTFSYPTTEGWGITYDGRRLIMSDGTATLHFLDPDTLAETDSVQVQDSDGPVAMLNELEYVGGTIYANVWQTDRIVMISPDTGAVVGRVDLTGLKRLVDSGDVLNGIAYDPVDKRLFVTGKLWPKLFEIRLVPAT